MPSNKVLEEKKQVVETLASKMQSAAAGVLVKYEGITVAEDTELRTALRKAGVEYTVMKNTLTGRACDIAGYGDMKQYLSGMTALAISQEDPIAPAKIMKEYADKIKCFDLMSRLRILRFATQRLEMVPALMAAGIMSQTISI